MESELCFERKELQEISSRAESLANVEGTNSSWKRVYLRLADAACELDAYVAKTEVHNDILMENYNIGKVIEELKSLIDSGCVVTSEDKIVEVIRKTKEV